ncbi:hypothetical protein Tco_0337150 [Tanacetum coccineum]
MEYVKNSKKVVVPMVQPKPVDPTQGTHKNTRVGGVRRTGGKGPMIRGEGGVPEPDESLKTKIVLKRKLTLKEKPVSKEKPVKEKLKKTKETMVEEEINDDLDYTLEEMKTQKLKGFVEYDDEPQMSPNAQLLLDFKRTRLNSHDGCSRKNKLSGDSIDLDRLPKSQTVIVPEVTTTEPTRPDQRGSTWLDFVLITIDETLTLVVQPITGVVDHIPSPPITTEPTTSKQKKHVCQIVTYAKRFNPMAKQFVES